VTGPGTAFRTIPINTLPARDATVKSVASGEPVGSYAVPFTADERIEHSVHIQAQAVWIYRPLTTTRIA
jgi:hypothetical protein